MGQSEGKAAEAELSPPVLGAAEAERRLLLLAELQARLGGRGAQSVLARNHRLVLRYSDPGSGRSGLTDPVLHVLLPGGVRHVSTDGSVLRLEGGGEFAAGDAGAAAMAICEALGLAPAMESRS